MSTESAECDFCAIAQGTDQSAEVICEDDNWVAFFPLEPATPGHTLVIPRKHVRNLWEVDEALGSDLMRAAVRVGRAIRKALQPEGMNLITSAGEAAEQTVFHLHIHVVPRWEADGFGDIWPPKGRYENSDLEPVADRIREACRNI